MRKCSLGSLRSSLKINLKMLATLALFPYSKEATLSEGYMAIRVCSIRTFVSLLKEHLMMEYTPAQIGVYIGK